ncbi:MAG: hypothetical protein MI743_12815 [Sneathiellales bacterium]|nr:hypothetical protein [Sneathiellales bacterium]
MNFAGKKLSDHYTGSTKMSKRERALLAENTKLKKRNRRLSTAMLYLVKQVEIRLPLLNRKKPEENKIEPVRSLASQRLKKNIVGKTWKPEKLDLNTPAENHTAPLKMQQIFANKKDPEIKQEKPLGISPQKSAEPSPSTIQDPEARALEISNELDIPPISHTPDLAPEEMTLLASPTKDNAKELTHLMPNELFTKREEQKISSQEASQTYRAVSIASAPVPDIDDLEQAVEEEEQKLVRQNNMMREAMLRRVNRLRW